MLARTADMKAARGCLQEVGSADYVDRSVLPALTLYATSHATVCDFGAVGAKWELFEMTPLRAELQHARSMCAS